jgi:N6-adenosine-specific RNA methylase IME4
VIDAWGFSYRTNAMCDKELIGMGYYFRQQHEQLLVAAKGHLAVPDPSVRPPSVFRVRRGRHSEKPALVYDLLEAMYPHFTEADRVELFARVPRPGWSLWGNELTVVA